MSASIVFKPSNEPEVSVIIPSLDGDRGGNVNAMIEALTKQSFRNLEIILSVNEYPNGHARNVGVAATTPTSRYLLFFDDDVSFGDENVVANMKKALEENPGFGLVGALIKRPLNQKGFFYTWIEYEGGRLVAKDVSSYTESTMVCHAGLGARRAVWEDFGGESSTIPTGTDTDLRLRMRMKGYKVILVPNAVVYHPFPRSVFDMWRRSWIHGFKHYQFRKVHPNALDEAPRYIGSYGDLLVLFLRWTILFLLHILFDRGRGFRFTPIMAIDSYIFKMGYIIGWIRAKRQPVLMR